MTLSVFPSVSNVGGGKPLSESNLLIPGHLDRGYAVFGFGLSGVASLPYGAILIAAGEAIVGGRRVRHSPFTQIDVGDMGGSGNRTRYINLNLAEDGSGNVSAVGFSADAAPAWMAAGTPAAYHVCLGRVTITSGAISEIVNARHFPGHGQSLVGRTETTDQRILNNCAVNNWYEVQDMVLAQFMAPRPCILSVRGIIHVKADAATGLYVHMANHGSPSTGLIAAGVYASTPNQWFPVPVIGAVEMAAGDVLRPRISVSPTTGPRDLTIGPLTYSAFAALLSDSEVGL